MEHTKLFKSNRSQAVRLPKAVAFPKQVTKVDIVAIGHARLITPDQASWDIWFDGPAASADFMNQREQPSEQKRKVF